MNPVILVADDDVLVRNIVTLLVQREGFFVISASDGQEALDISRGYAGPIALVITDMQMPRLDGAGLCARLLDERPGIKALVMSGSMLREIISENTNMRFLPKPFDGKTLIRQVKELLNPDTEVGETRHNPSCETVNLLAS